MVEIESVYNSNPFDYTLRDLPGYGQYYSLQALNDDRIERLPYCIRVILESAMRNCDEFGVTSKDVENILNWEQTSKLQTEIPFCPARVLLQDFTGVPAIVDLAAMRDAIARLGGKPGQVNPLVPVDLVIDHSVQADSWRNSVSREINETKEFDRNLERFAFLKWGAESFKNLLIVPPGSGIVHQVNLEYLARVVVEKGTSDACFIYPDSVVGTDSHTTMIGGLGVLGWGVGGIEAEAVMLGQPISMVLPEVVGFEITGTLDSTVTATDLVLTVTEILRSKRVVNKFVEFFGSGCATLTLADKATIANMSPEYGATIGFFPIDEQALIYLRQSGRKPREIDLIQKYMEAQFLFRTYDGDQPVVTYSGDILRLDLSTVKSCVSGPKRPHDLVYLSDVKKDFTECVTRPSGFKGFGLSEDMKTKSVSFNFQDSEYTLTNGSIVIAALTSCTNTSNPSVMLGAGLVAKNALARGLRVMPYIKTSLAPGSAVVHRYLEAAGLLKPLEDLGFFIVGLGCTTCIGNSGDLNEEVTAVVENGDLIATSVLSGNRNFEGRVHPLTQANYLMSPMLVVAFAIAGNIGIDLTTEPLGVDQNGTNVYLHEIWPSRESLSLLEKEVITPKMYTDCYDTIYQGNTRWDGLPISKSALYPWESSSTYIRNPPFFQETEKELPRIDDITSAYCLLLLGDSVTTDHISPAGKISRDSPAAAYLQSKKVKPLLFNSYGSRRGNHEIMMRGTFGNIRIVNLLMNGEVGPKTIHIPSGQKMFVFDAAQMYEQEKRQLIIIAGKDYGSGSSRDWAAKGPALLGVKAVIAESFEKIHRSNLIGMGILPIQFEGNDTVTSLGLTGHETYSLPLNGGNLEVSQAVVVTTSTGITFNTRCRIDTEVEMAYYKNGGILHYVLRSMIPKC